MQLHLSYVGCPRIPPISLLLPTCQPAGHKQSWITVLCDSRSPQYITSYQEEEEDSSVVSLLSDLLLAPHMLPPLADSSFRAAARAARAARPHCCSSPSAPAIFFHQFYVLC